MYEKIFGPKILVLWDTFRVNVDPIFQTPTQNISPHGFFGSPKGHKTPSGGRFDGGFSFYWTSLGPPVNAIQTFFLNYKLSQEVPAVSSHQYDFILKC